MRTRRAAMTLVVLAVVGVTSSCDVRVAGRRCAQPGATAQDRTHVLVCRNGRWTRSMTKAAAAQFLVAIVRAHTPVAVSTGNGHTCAAMDGGQVRCWGFNSSGQLGDGTVSNRSTSAEVPGVTTLGYSALSAASRGTEIHGRVELGAEYSCAVSPSKFKGAEMGTARCWGYNGFGQLGDATTTNRRSPVDVPGSGLYSLVTGIVHTCGVFQFSGVKCWGQNAAGQLGDGTTTARSSPVKVTGIDGFEALALGSSHTCALSASTPNNGQVRCWGANGAGQLGDGTTTQRLTPVSANISAVLAVAAGGDTTCALMWDRTVECWGANDHGQLGDGTLTSRSTPAKVFGLNGGVKAISVGQDHACAIVADGSVRCWGANDHGQLGDGTTSDRLSPVYVFGVDKATSLDTGASHTCVVADKKVACWGRNDFGQLGDGTTTEHHTVVVAPQ